MPLKVYVRIRIKAGPSDLSGIKIGMFVIHRTLANLKNALTFLLQSCDVHFHFVIYGYLLGLVLGYSGPD
jgi:hypothetical protein